MPRKGIEPGILRAVKHAEGRHYLNAPNRAKVSIHDAAGILLSAERCTEDDPLLYAYAVRDELRKALGVTYQAFVWCEAVINATPDELMESGAQ